MPPRLSRPHGRGHPALDLWRVSTEEGFVGAAGPTPVRRAFVALLLGMVLGLLAALLQPRNSDRSGPSEV